MNTTRCSKGHTYDSSMYSFCPVCAGGASAPAMDVSFNPTSATMPPEMFEDIGATAPPVASFVPPAVDWGSVSNDTIEATNAPEDYSLTGPVNDFGTKVTPVVGWLVCIEGPDKGTDYRIRDGYNYIGRNANMDISVQGDTTISGDKNAVIIYDEMNAEFFVAHQSGSNPVRLNGRMVAFTTPIAAYDVLTIGRSKFLFVPLCGERFKWENEEA